MHINERKQNTNSYNRLNEEFGISGEQMLLSFVKRIKQSSIFQFWVQTHF
ncbi:hypothetical protein DOY81_005978 [Sarcophaga bullata]|nr:hypothetical protein DOY81_005978 [Sarcophaga bullata]